MAVLAQKAICFCPGANCDVENASPVKHQRASYRGLILAARPQSAANLWPHLRGGTRRHQDPVQGVEDVQNQHPGWSQQVVQAVSNVEQRAQCLHVFGCQDNAICRLAVDGRSLDGCRAGS